MNSDWGWGENQKTLQNMYIHISMYKVRPENKVRRGNEVGTGNKVGPGNEVGPRNEVLLLYFFYTNTPVQNPAV